MIQDSKIKKSLALKNVLTKYNYKLPKGLIAQSPASPRDSAKLLVYNQTTAEVVFDKFYNLTKYLPPKSVLVFNDTKVIPARLYLKKETGGQVEILYLKTMINSIEVLANRKLNLKTRLTLNK